jgi:O-acetyl-ADP-ribose deacetylase (regulator of RNase III)
MALAGEYRLNSIAFPAISCGVYGFPPDLAVPIAVREVCSGVKTHLSLEKVIFCCFDKAMAEHYRVTLISAGYSD